jgi:hypothetical protein
MTTLADALHDHETIRHRCHAAVESLTSIPDLTAKLKEAVEAIQAADRAAMAAAFQADPTRGDRYMAALFAEYAVNGFDELFEILHHLDTEVGCDFDGAISEAESEFTDILLAGAEVTS